MARFGIARLAATTAAGVLLAGCVNHTALDDLAVAKPPDTAFSLALFQDYSFLAHSFGDVGQAGYTSFDEEGSTPLAATPTDIAALANTYAQKALTLTTGLQVDPEPGRDKISHDLRDRLVRALDRGREAFPRDAARAQADFDCWLLDSTVIATLPASETCHKSLEVTLPRLEAEVKAAPPPKDEKSAKDGKDDAASPSP